MLRPLAFACLLSAAPLNAANVPPGFQDTVVFSGLSRPTAVKFAADGRVFVAEKSGLIKVYDSLTASTPTVFADLRTKVHDYWDRGLLGLELHPDFPNTPYVYVLYTLDGPIGWAGPGSKWNDACPSPPGPTTDGCVVGARLSRLTASGSVMIGAENVFVEDWCQQFPSHSIGSVVFGGDGALYVSGGDGANFNGIDWGQSGSPRNPCGDPPAGVGGAQAPPTAEGGALRAQDLETAGDPVTMDGSILRLDPLSGQAMPDNPLFGGATSNDDRIVAYGFRNPFRITARPGTNEIWVGDVGWNSAEEIDRIPSPTTAVLNFGWPCYEGFEKQPGYASANLSICSSLYARPGAATAPYFAYTHGEQVVAGETCGVGSSSIAGLAFYTTGNYPDIYPGALFFTDYSRKCVWAMLAGPGGLPEPSQRQTFMAGGGGLTQLSTGPGGDLFAVDYDGGAVRRIQYRGPTAVATGSPESGIAPLTVLFDGSASSDPDPGDALTFSWDLDGNGAFDDSNELAPQFTYGASGVYTAKLRVTDPSGLSDVATVVVNVSNGPPVANIASPVASLRWTAGQTISFAGSATDPEDGPLPPSALIWTLILQHCPDDCHQHVVEEFTGVESGSFVTPDHEYPSYLELRLLARDSAGATHTTSVALRPKTVALTFLTSPPGLTLGSGPDAEVTPYTRTVIVGSSNSVSAPDPQARDGANYFFDSWSDGGEQSHNVIAPAVPAELRAVFRSSIAPALSVSDATVIEGNAGSTSAVFTVSLSVQSGPSVTVKYSTSNGSARAGSDYLPVAGTITLSPGVVSATVTVSVLGDRVPERDETFQLRLSQPTAAVIARGMARGVILDDDRTRGPRIRP